MAAACLKELAIAYSFDSSGAYCAWQAFTKSTFAKAMPWNRIFGTWYHGGPIKF
jgi:hypothetical protein